MKMATPVEPGHCTDNKDIASRTNGFWGFDLIKVFPEPPAPDRFWDKVAVGAPAHCWPWMASTKADGYGQVKILSRPIAASRAAYQIATGKDPIGKMVCHHCDNPACCNPAHLYAGTKSDNERDKFARGRRTHWGEGNPARKLSSQQVDHIRRLFNQGRSNTEIGRMLGVHHSTISKIRTGASWR